MPVAHGRARSYTGPTFCLPNKHPRRHDGEASTANGGCAAGSGARRHRPFPVWRPCGARLRNALGGVALPDRLRVAREPREQAMNVRRDPAIATSSRSWAPTLAPCLSEASGRCASSRQDIRYVDVDMRYACFAFLGERRRCHMALSVVPETAWHRGCETPGNECRS